MQHGRGGRPGYLDRWQLRRLVRGDGRPGRGLSLAEEDDDEYRWRMDDPPDDVIAAVMRLDERREKTAELSALCEDDHTQHECAAGALCAAPPGTDVSASAHCCLDCRGKIHCAMWCGENWGEYIKSDRCKITPDQLSATGRASVQGSDHERSPCIGFVSTGLRALLPFLTSPMGYILRRRQRQLPRPPLILSLLVRGMLSLLAC